MRIDCAGRVVLRPGAAGTLGRRLSLGILRLDRHGRSLYGWRGFPSGGQPILTEKEL